jgi:predicted transcriptional regulator
MNSACQYVTSSSVRVDTVLRLSEQQTATSELIEQLDASSSAVYSALSDLDTRGLISETADGWELTGRGLVVADTVSHRRSTEAFLAGDPDYWEDRRTDVLPERFRLRLPEIGDYEIVRLDGPAVNRLETEVIDRINSVDSCRVASHVYKRSYEEQLISPETQLLLTPQVVDSLVEKAKTGRIKIR